MTWVPARYGKVPFVIRRFCSLLVAEATSAFSRHTTSVDHETPQNLEVMLDSFHWTCKARGLAHSLEGRQEIAATVLTEVRSDRSSA